MPDPLPEHDESHVGPYGVEAPLEWDFVMTVTEVSVAMKIDHATNTGRETGQRINASGDIDGESDTDGQAK